MANEVLGKDIRLSDDNDIVFNTFQDFSIVPGKQNYAQAIHIRLNTEKGEYISNPSYGSEVFKVFGRSLNQLSINQLKGYIVETLKQDPRLKTINDIKIKITNAARKEMKTTLSVTPIGSQTPLNMVFPLFI